MKTVISAGHNPGTDPGAIGQGRQEANENVRMADRVVLLLRSWGVDVDLMPHNVGNLQAEINWMNARYKTYDSAIGVQIHRNAGGGTGNEIWTSNYKTQWAIATTILNAMTRYTKMPSRGVKDVKTNPLGWINNLLCASVLVEARFIDRDPLTDETALIDALGIAAGIADVLGIPVGRTPEEIEAQRRAEEAQAVARAEADRLAKIAEQARLEAEKALQAKLKAEEDAKRALEEKAIADKAKADADKAVKDAVNNENLNILQLIFKAIKDIINAILAKKG